MHQGRPVIRFGRFEADLHTRELRRDGARVPLQLQPFLVLEALLVRPGDLVTREELRRAIWPEGTFVSFDRGLTSAMRKVREALGERADRPVYIETLTGRGYRFIAPVTIADAPAARHCRPRWIPQMAAVLIIGLSEGGLGPNTMSAERLAAAEQLSAYACLLKSQGRFDEGLAAIRRAHAIAPESARFTAEVGLHLHATRQYDEEMRMLQQAVRQDSASADAWLHLGLGYLRRSDVDRAIPALERANQLSSRHGTWLDRARKQQRLKA
ncbi:MAG TPA: winged helix-turn-helix domain-containing protein [Vicinamibacterales bacterium]|nr:winged helix-turn-helix domain-containing protein [Vicinamibacterales bacterium]